MFTPCSTQIESLYVSWGVWGWGVWTLQMIVVVCILQKKDESNEAISIKERDYASCAINHNVLYCIVLYDKD